MFKNLKSNVLRRLMHFAYINVKALEHFNSTVFFFF